MVLNVVKKIIIKLLEGKFFITIYNKINKNFLKIIKGVDFITGYICRCLSSIFIEVDNSKVIFFQCNHRYACNPKYITEKLHELSPNVKIIWCINKEFYNKNKYPEYVNLVKRYSWKAYKEIMSSKIVIDNGHIYQEGAYIPKKKGQIYIQVWHGSLGIKRFDTDSIKSRVRAAKRCGKMTDFCISNSRFETIEVYKKTFWKNAEILEFGHPRNDILVNNNKSKCVNLRTLFSIPNDAMVVLYAPTYRDNKNNAQVYSLDVEELIAAIEAKSGKKCVILWRFHFSNRKNDKRNNLHHVIDVTDYDDIQELMLIADIGITDYSSWIFDFILTRKPGFIFAPDVDNYNIERGFYYPLDQTPFPIAYDNKMLCGNIREFDYENYCKKVKLFLDKMGCIENGKASEKTASFVIKLLEKKDAN